MQPCVFGKLSTDKTAQTSPFLHRHFSAVEKSSFGHRSRVSYLVSTCRTYTALVLCFAVKVYTAVQVSFASLSLLEDPRPTTTRRPGELCGASGRRSRVAVVDRYTGCMLYVC